MQPFTALVVAPINEGNIYEGIFMFLPVSLNEAIAWLDKNNVKGVTSHDLLRLGYAGYFQICIPLSERAYSPLKSAEIFQKNFDAGRDIDIQKEHEASYVELYGVYALPPKTLFELESKGKTRTAVVFSLDEADSFSIYKDITTDDLRVTYQALKSLISRIEISPAVMQANAMVEEGAPENQAEIVTNNTSVKWTSEKLDELYTFHLNEKNVKKTRAFKKATADHYGVTTKRIEQLLKKHNKNKPSGLGLLVSQTLRASHPKK